MCFSAEASFTAAVLLGATGVATIKHISSRSQLFLASIPLLFALQQFSEGIIWIHLTKQIGSAEMMKIAQSTYLTFAFLIWPIWSPLSFVTLETVPWKRYLLSLIFVCGILLSSFNLLTLLSLDHHVQIVNHSLQYIGQFPSQTIIYPLIVLLPCFISSLKHVRRFGLLALLSCLIANFFYQNTFISVWCFFAAVISLFVYKVIKDNNPYLEEKRLRKE